MGNYTNKLTSNRLLVLGKHVVSARCVTHDVLAGDYQRMYSVHRTF